MKQGSKGSGAQAKATRGRTVTGNSRAPRAHPVPLSVFTGEERSSSGKGILRCGALNLCWLRAGEVCLTPVTRTCAESCRCLHLARVLVTVVTRRPAPMSFPELQED